MVLFSSHLACVWNGEFRYGVKTTWLAYAHPRLLAGPPTLLMVLLQATIEQIRGSAMDGGFYTERFRNGVLDFEAAANS